MTTDEQEALSISLTRGLWCVPLSSSRIAVFQHPMVLVHTIVDTWQDAIALPRPKQTRRHMQPASLMLDVEIDL